jgi:hypothetical protein
VDGSSIESEGSSELAGRPGNCEWVRDSSFAIEF